MIKKKIRVTKMQSRSFTLLWKAVTHIPVLFLITRCSRGELSETEAFLNFIRAVDPQNELRISWNDMVPHPCSYEWKGVKCNFQATTITEIRLENRNLTGIIDADSLCKLKKLRTLSLAKNLIHGNIPHSISYCRRLTYLNLSSNVLSGRIPVAALTNSKHLRNLDLSNNHFTGNNNIPDSKLESKHLDKYSMKTTATKIYNVRKLVSAMEGKPPNASSSTNSGEVLSDSVDPNANSPGSDQKAWYDKVEIIIPLVLAIVVFTLFAYFVNKKVSKMSKKTEILKSLAHSPQKTPPPESIEDGKPNERFSELVFFVEEQERFEMEDLLEATADLRSQTPNSSLYKVTIKNNMAYAVKRLKKLQVSFEQFGRTMREIGNLKHQNILPLVGYNSTKEEKLLFYRYQSNGSLLNLLEDYIEGKRQFPWKLRLPIASGIAKGLDFIYHNYIDNEIIPHGNIKLSNILLDENGEPLISEYGISKFLDPKKAYLSSSNGYTAPEKTSSEKGDVFSFGIILLELLTGKTVERSGIDLPKWVRSMVREEWTGEVLDKELDNAARQYAFPLLNIALKCVSNLPKERPTVAEIMEKIEEVVNIHEDLTISSMGSIESSSHEFCILHSVIPETWDTPGSNY